jgi:hypothetical protein
VDERLAANGILVVAIDVRLPREAPYPASVADANHGIRYRAAIARAAGSELSPVELDMSMLLAESQAACAGTAGRSGF